MRLRKGSKVEILGDAERLSVEWRCAQIISGNGHTYSIQYDCSGVTSDASVARVPRKVIRPCLPVIEGLEWEANDIVEVYDDGSWKAATVLKFIGGDIFLVRLWISCKDLQVHKVNMRVCQSWQNDRWIVKPLGAGNSRVGKSSWNLTFNSYKLVPDVHQARKSCLPRLDSSDLQESHLVSPSTLKRVSPYSSSPIETYPRKMRAVENAAEHNRLKSTAHLLEKVDVAYPQNNMGENCMHNTLYNDTNKYYEMGKENLRNITTHFHERIEEPDYTCSGISSVGSCSVMSSNTDKNFSNTSAGPCQDEDDLSSDAESEDVGNVDKGPISQKDVVAERIHTLELHAYQRTLAAMYASGLLSWEQEELLTNLRISLNISNDEHLMEGQCRRLACLASNG